ncbi:cytochrome c oxidase subunit 5B, mitochondrial-like [Orussus abietinus]|uniref:cytochrome c oxidase subunit 5B, mitochondrial-like n=1 Tax=Orussus abietinus TaxID=222816 RepID=UPI000625A9B7|nr:cytochrome c oxidase subunit 5B, mitochondrial-like [Orussus abietinus]
MALYGRGILRIARPSLLYSTTRPAKTSTLPDPLELATGLEKYELLQKMAGNDDPFDMNVIKRGPSTKDCPTLVPSAFDSRLVGCICEEEATSINWMWLHQGSPRRCECGFWFKLVPKRLD